MVASGEIIRAGHRIIFSGFSLPALGVLEPKYTKLNVIHPVYTILEDSPTSHATIIHNRESVSSSLFRLWGLFSSSKILGIDVGYKQGTCIGDFIFVQLQGLGPIDQLDP